MVHTKPQYFKQCRYFISTGVKSGIKLQIHYSKLHRKLSYNTDYGNDYSLYFAGFIGSNNKLISCYIEMSNLYNLQAMACLLILTINILTAILAYKKAMETLSLMFGSSARDSCYEGCKFVFQLNMYSSYYKILYTSGSTINCQLYAYDELGNDVERAVFYSGENNLL